jgi:hypothetical protein
LHRSDNARFADVKVMPYFASKGEVCSQMSRIKAADCMDRHFFD